MYTAFVMEAAGSVKWVKSSGDLSLEQLAMMPEVSTYQPASPVSDANGRLLIEMGQCRLPTASFTQGSKYFAQQAQVWKYWPSLMRSGERTSIALAPALTIRSPCLHKPHSRAPLPMENIGSKWRTGA